MVYGESGCVLVIFGAVKFICFLIFGPSFGPSFGTFLQFCTLIQKYSVKTSSQTPFFFFFFFWKFYWYIIFCTVWYKTIIVSTVCINLLSNKIITSPAVKNSWQCSALLFVGSIKVKCIRQQVSSFYVMVEHAMPSVIFQRFTALSQLFCNDVFIFCIDRPSLLVLQFAMLANTCELCIHHYKINM